MQTKNPATTYDILKTLLVVLMLIDHVGFFFLPEWPVLRAVGRACAPAWMFLVGYGARNGQRDTTLWAAATLMILAELVMQQEFTMLNILLNLALARWLALRGADALVRRPSVLAPLFIVLVVVNVALYPVLEYGVFAFLFALWGVMVKRGARIANMWGVACVLFFIVQQSFYFQFAVPNIAIMAAGVLVMATWLARFVPQPVDAGKAAPLLRFCGRQTLLIYIVHYLTFLTIVRVFL